MSAEDTLKVICDALRTLADNDEREQVLAAARMMLNMAPPERPTFNYPRPQGGAAK